MKKNLILLAACGGMLLAANESKAQETVVVDETVITTTNVECKDHYSSSWRKNWFIQLGAGAHMPFVEGTKMDDSQPITAYYNVGFGHRFSPYLALRFTGFYGATHWDNGQFSKSKNANLNIELMWDLINSAHGVNPNRVFSLIPFVGVGGAFTWDYKGAPSMVLGSDGRPKGNMWTLPVSAGLQLRFRLCKYVDFFAEGRFMFYADSWNRNVHGRPIDVDAVAIGGFNINIGGREFDRYNPCEYLDYINSLNGQVNDLRGALATTAAALAAAEAQLPCPEVQAAPVRTPAPMLSAVRFKINSARVTDEEMVNVYNVAQWMKSNSDVNVVIRGYADRETGTSDYNMKLSERRAQSVYDILTKEYGIDGSRLKCEQFGSDVQPYDVNNWNRIVIFAE